MKTKIVIIIIRVIIEIYNKNIKGCEKGKNKVETLIIKIK